MKANRRIVEVVLDGIEIRAAGGTADEKTGKHVVSARLVWPRPSIAEKLAVKTIGLRDGSISFKTAEWPDKILFKEVVQGPFSICIEISDRVAASTADGLAGELLKAFVKVAGDGASEVAGVPWMGSLLRGPLRFLESMGTKDGTGLPVTGSGSIDLEALPGWKAGGWRRFRIPLVTARDICRVQRRRSGGEMRTMRQVLLRAGEQNGVVKIALRPYD
ncbi:MAG: hypothetical protein E4H02_09495 [Lentisphaerales bacterium]|jgi:hypothetical protein|nr:MAG: hypothetical protein E4H02_09495 [Lentisphaerales bacterium]